MAPTSTTTTPAATTVHGPRSFHGIDRSVSSASSTPPATKRPSRPRTIGKGAGPRSQVCSAGAVDVAGSDAVAPPVAGAAVATAADPEPAAPDVADVEGVADVGGAAAG